MTSERRTWQCVLIAWGERYPVADMNRLVASVAAHSRGPDRFVLLSDRPRPGLLPEVQVRPIPDYYLQPQFRQAGCQTKLCLFEPGVVPDDMQAVYLDLDTMVMGDLSRVLGAVDRPEQLAILQSAILPFGAFARWLWRVSGKRYYARGNSSVVVFHPRHCADIARQFRSLWESHGPDRFRPLVADERFMSWAAQPVMRAVPTSLVVKFPTEFMQPWQWLVNLRATLPWIRRRREGLVAVTFPGVSFKADDLARLHEGAVVADRKGRKLFWTDRALGSLRRKILSTFSPGPR